MIIGRLSDLLGENLDSVDLPRYFDELGAGLKARAKDDFYQYGISGRFHNQRHNAAGGSQK